MQQNYQMHASGTAGDSKATLDVRVDGKISAIYIECVDSGVSTGEDGDAELSFGSTNSVHSNDVSQVIAFCGWSALVATSGALGVSEFRAYEGLDIPVGAGERLHLHFVGDQSANHQCKVLVVVEEKGSSTIKNRRR